MNWKKTVTELDCNCKQLDLQLQFMRFRNLTSCSSSVTDLFDELLEDRLGPVGTDFNR